MTRNNSEISPAQWSQFAAFAEANGIDLGNEDDWGPWWDAWIDGYSNAVNDWMNQ